MRSLRGILASSGPVYALTDITQPKIILADRDAMKRCLLPVLLALLFAIPSTAFAQKDVSWETLAKVKLKKEESKFTPEFSEEIQALAGQKVKLQGFMLPLDQAAKQQHFILSANPVANCFFCMPGGPETMIEIKADKAVEFSYDPIVINGRLELLSDDPMGMYYRITDAQVLR